jgi:hypothetical protein
VGDPAHPSPHPGAASIDGCPRSRSAAPARATAGAIDGPGTIRPAPGLPRRARIGAAAVWEVEPGAVADGVAAALRAGPVRPLQRAKPGGGSPETAAHLVATAEPQPAGRPVHPVPWVRRGELSCDNGSRLELLSATESAGHGETTDLLVVDEAWVHQDAAIERGIRPTMATRRDAQLWAMSTAGTAKSIWWRGKLDAGRLGAEMGVTEGSCLFEWAASPDDDPPTRRSGGRRCRRLAI